jgi:hypothetical protein
MIEMCSVCIIRAQRDDDDFLPCSTACFRAALSAAGYRGLMEITRIGAKCYDDGQRDMFDRCIAVILSMKDSDECEGEYCRTLDAVAKGVRRVIEEKP